MTEHEKTVRIIQKFLALCMLLILAGCENDVPEASQKASPQASVRNEAQQLKGTLHIYSPLTEEELAVYAYAFKEDTGITVEYTRLGAGEMVDTLEATKEAPAVSVLLGGSSDYYENAMQSGLLESYQSEELVYVLDGYKDRDGFWNPLYLGIIGFVCNKAWFLERDMPYPETWDDLLDTVYKGQIAMGSPMTSGTSYTAMAALMTMRGEAEAWRYFEGVDQNIAYYTRSGFAPIHAVKNGEIAVGIVFSHDGQRAMLDGYEVEVVYPQEAVAMEIGACALVKNAPAEEREFAKKFIDWMLSSRGQKCFAQAKSCRYPINMLVRAADGLPALDSLNIVEVDLKWSATVQKSLRVEYCERFKKAQVPHDICLNGKMEGST